VKHGHKDVLGLGELLDPPATAGTVGMDRERLIERFRCIFDSCCQVERVLEELEVCCGKDK